MRWHLSHIAGLGKEPEKGMPAEPAAGVDASRKRGGRVEDGPIDRFVKRMEEILFAAIVIPEWCLTLILPIGFSLLTIRLLLAAGEDIRAAFKWSDTSSGGRA